MADSDFRHIIPISGKDSAATAIVQMARQPELNYEFIYNDTMSELPEVDNWLRLMESYLEAPIHRIGANLEDIIYEQGILPSFHTRFCTRLAKIYPMEDWIAKDNKPAKIYLGIRADEERIGYESKRSSIVPVYPLQELGITLSLSFIKYWMTVIWLRPNSSGNRFRIWCDRRSDYLRETQFRN